MKFGYAEPMIRLALAALLVLSAAPVLAQAPPAIAPSPAATARPATVRVALTTTLGPIVLELEKDRAPITTANFLHYLDARRLDGIAFYRAVHNPGEPDKGFIQGGQRDGAKLFPPIAHEPTTKTGISHVDGTISMARLEPGSARCDFFVTIGPQLYMDADPTKPGDNLGYAAFGHIVEGMDIIRQILAAPVSPTLGEGVMKGQMLAQPVKVLTARRVN